MTLGELIDMLAPPPEVLLQRQIATSVHQMEAAEAELIEQVMVSGAMPGEFGVCLRRRPLGCWPRFAAVLR